MVSRLAAADLLLCFCYVGPHFVQLIQLAFGKFTYCAHLNFVFWPQRIMGFSVMQRSWSEQYCQYVLERGHLQQAEHRLLHVRDRELSVHGKMFLCDFVSGCRSRPFSLRGALGLQSPIHLNSLCARCMHDCGCCLYSCCSCVNRARVVTRCCVFVLLLTLSH